MSPEDIKQWNIDHPWVIDPELWATLVKGMFPTKSERAAQADVESHPTEVFDLEDPDEDMMYETEYDEDEFYG